MCFRADLDAVGVKKNFLSLPEIEPQPSSLYPVVILTEISRLLMIIE
jgi:hypothetical protein